MKKYLLFFIMIISGICGFVALMVYLQSDYERNNCDKISATIVEVGDIDKKVIAHGRVYVEKYYHDITIRFKNNSTVVKNIVKVF